MPATRLVFTLLARFALLTVLACLPLLVQAQTPGEPASLAGSAYARARAQLLISRPATEALPSPVERVEHNVLRRPIELSDKYRHWIDRSYPYGSTQLGKRQPHLGVEFVNPRGTPVYAAEAGTVVHAGSDSATLLGPKLNYYGNAVIIAHPLQTLAGQPLFTLYGHLDQVEARTGDLLAARERIGTVGASGVAIGAHLHFEVRAGDPFDYRMTRNPELWLQHYMDCGLLAGALRDADGLPIEGKRLTLRAGGWKRDIYTYEGDLAQADPVWRENFVLSDLPAGSYELLALSDSGAVAFREELEIIAYKTTYLEITLDS